MLMKNWGLLVNLEGMGVVGIYGAWESGEERAVEEARDESRWKEVAAAGTAASVGERQSMDAGPLGTAPLPSLTN